MVSRASQHDAGTNAENEVLHLQVECQLVTAITVCPESLDLVPHIVVYDLGGCEQTINRILENPCVRSIC